MPKNCGEGNRKAGFGLQDLNRSRGAAALGCPGRATLDNGSDTVPDRFGLYLFLWMNLLPRKPE